MLVTTVTRGLLRYPLILAMLFPQQTMVRSVKQRAVRQTGTITYTADVLGTEVSATIDLEVIASEHIIYAPDNGVAFVSFPSDSVLTKSINIIDSYGVQDTHWTAVSDAAWLVVTSSGTTAEGLTLTADPSGLAANTLYMADVEITADNNNVSNTETVKVELWVGDTDPVRPYLYVHTGVSNVVVYHIYDRTIVRTISNVGSRLSDMEVSHDAEQSFAFARNNGMSLLVTGYGNIYNADTGDELSGGSGTGRYDWAEIVTSANGN
jgi:hypothetical protein